MGFQCGAGLASIRKGLNGKLNQCGGLFFRFLFSSKDSWRIMLAFEPFIEAEMSENKKSILIIDDEDDVCQIIKEKFEPLGYTILTASDGAAGFRQTEEGMPDCVLLDILIPKGEDGLTYLRKVRFYRHHDPQKQTRIRKTPVIVITGAGQKMRPLFEFEGISGFVEKPFDLANLRGKIEHVLQIR